MTREEAKREIEKVFEPAFANYIVKALTDGATESDAEPQEWISVKDRLPTKNGTYKITYQTADGYRYVAEDYFYTERNLFHNESFYQAYHKGVGRKIVAWMPNPSPYKGE